MMVEKLPPEEEVRQQVRCAYGRIAGDPGRSCCDPREPCCGSASPNELARALGYTQDELAGLPESANMGLSCGNPAVLASLRPGEAVLDLGSGGGLDVFVAARSVGPGGRAIGVDMTPEMLHRARANALRFTEGTGLGNVQFRLGEIEHLPVADESVDVVISNCVINLSPDKPSVWREMFRVLKPGGRVAVSDLALVQPLPEAVRGSLDALVGCIAGAVAVEDTVRMAQEAGFAAVEVRPQPMHSQALFETAGRTCPDILDLLPPGATIGDYVVSLDLTAAKPDNP
jgi:arsenite methyltransferase